MSPFENMTWTCHVCGAERPDAKISVRSHERVLSGRVRMTENVRYCNDRAECVEGSKTTTFVPIAEAGL